MRGTHFPLTSSIGKIHRWLGKSASRASAQVNHVAGITFRLLHFGNGRTILLSVVSQPNSKHAEQHGKVHGEWSLTSLDVEKKVR
jgi:hypothetical protein